MSNNSRYLVTRHLFYYYYCFSGHCINIYTTSGWKSIVGLILVVVVYYYTIVV